MRQWEGSFSDHSPVGAETNPSVSSPAGDAQTGNDLSDNGSWAPQTREDWVELFADGNLRAGAKRDEEDAKAKAAGGGKDGKKEEDKTPPPPLSFADRLLGNKRQENAS